jgi:hypothetical protein
VSDGLGDGLGDGLADGLGVVEGVGRACQKPGHPVCLADGDGDGVSDAPVGTTTAAALDGVGVTAW